jgi:uncharacterized membrane protein YkvI
MDSMNAATFRRYIMPGLVFQGVIIGGGYGTGRELVEYFAQYGPIGGILGMWGVTMVVWAVVIALTFEFARVFRHYDYRSFLIELLGPFWLAFELLYLTPLVIVLAVVGSAAGSLLRDFFGIPYLFGVAVMLAAVGFLTFKGSALIEKSFSVWSTFIYIVYILFLVAALTSFGGDIRANLATGTVLPGWALGGFKYALYSLGVIAAILFTARHMESRRQAIGAGVLASIIGLVPAFLFLIAILGQYPEVIAEEIPAVFVLQRAGVPILLTLFVIMLFGTLIQTGTGMIHGVNERIQSAFSARGHEFPSWARPVVATVLLLASLGLARFGIIALVAKGYGSMSWGIFVVYVVPVLTVGVFKIVRRGRQAEIVS